MWSTGVCLPTVRFFCLISILSVYYEANFCVKVSKFSLSVKRPHTNSLWNVGHFILGSWFVYLVVRLE